MEQPSVLSFAFSKRKDPNKLIGTTAITQDEVFPSSKAEYVSSFDGEHSKSNCKDTDKPLVIPLIHNNKWHVPKPEDLENENESEEKIMCSSSRFENTGDSITDEAVLELVKEASEDRKQWEKRGIIDTSRAIPLLMANKIPEGYETDDKLDVSLRPDQAAEADYDQVPIEQYGMALLRGMGYKEGMGIGKNNTNKPVGPIDAVARPKGLGLGADRSSNTQQMQKDTSTLNTEVDAKLELKRGAHCLIISSKHKESYGIVEGLDEDNCRVMVKLTIGGSVVTISQYAVNLVSKKEYDKNSKYLNKAKVEKYREEKVRHANSNSQDEHKHSSGHDHGNANGDQSKNAIRSRDKKSRNRHSKESEEHTHSSRHSSSRHRSRSPVMRKDDGCDRKNTLPGSLWMFPQLRVRIIDQRYKNGKYFKNKVIIEDVIDLESCICRTEDGKILENVSQSQLETVIPKSEAACVMVVSGKHKGKVGEVVERNKRKCTASVQCLPDCDEILNLDYEVICEYTGTVHS